MPIRRDEKKLRNVITEKSKDRNMGKTSSMKVEINSPYWKILAKEQLDKWKIYGAATEVLRERIEFDAVIGSLTRNRTYRVYSSQAEIGTKGN